MNEIKGIVSGNEVDISKVAMIVDGVDKGWEVRRQNGDILWAADRTLIGTDTIQMKGYGLPLKSIHIEGNTQQTGTPSPDNIIMPEFVGLRTGNLFDITMLESGIYLAANGNKYGNVTNGVRAGTKIKASPNTVYTLSAYSSANISLRIFEWSNGTFIKQTPKYNMSGSVSLTVTTDAETTEIAFNIEGENGQYATNIMLNTGSTPLPYEPYGWKVPITCAGQTVPVYLGQTQTVRRVKKWVLTGEESWNRAGSSHGYFTNLPSTARFVGVSGIISSHYKALMSSADGTIRVAQGAIEVLIYDNCTSVSDFESYLAAQYAAGTPVTIWYVLATEQTGIVNEPLAKIGDYADELSITDEVTIPIAVGANTLTVDTSLAPSRTEITGHVKAIT